MQNMAYEPEANGTEYGTMHCELSVYRTTRSSLHICMHGSIRPDGEDAGMLQLLQMIHSDKNEPLFIFTNVPQRRFLPTTSKCSCTQATA